MRRCGFRLLCLLGLLGLTGKLPALDLLSVSDATAKLGSRAVLELELQADSPVAALQFELDFDPTRLTLEVGSASIAPGRGGHALAAQSIRSGRTRMVVYPNSGRELGSGPLATLPVTVLPGAPVGNTLVRLVPEIILASVNAQIIPGTDLKDGEVEIARGESAISITGTIRYFSDDSPVPGAEVIFTGGSGSQRARTDSSGQYRLSVSASAVPAFVTPFIGSVRDVRTALDVRDLVALTQSFAAENLSVDPFAFVASDINLDGVVDGSDLEALRFWFLGTNLADTATERTLTSPWRFYRSNVLAGVPDVDGEALVGLTSPNTRVLLSVTESLSEQDFVALRMGDVSGDWPSRGLGEASEHIGLAQLASAVAVPGDVVGMALQGLFIDGLLGLQIMIHWDPSLVTMVGITSSGLPGFDPAQHVAIQQELGQAIVVWNEPDGNGVDLGNSQSILDLALSVDTEAQEGDTLLEVDSLDSLLVFEDEAISRNIRGSVISVQAPSEAEPIDRLPVFIERFESGEVRLEISTQQGVRTVVEASETLDAGDWVRLAVINGDGEVSVVTDDAGIRPNRFYRFLRSRE